MSEIWTDADPGIAMEEIYQKDLNIALYTVIPPHRGKSGPCSIFGYPKANACHRDHVSPNKKHFQVIFKCPGCGRLYRFWKVDSPDVEEPRRPSKWKPFVRSKHT